MKTAISLPDETFERATKRAAALGVSRSQLFVTAVHRYLDDLDAGSLSAQIDAAVALVGEDDSTRAAAAAGRQRLARGAEDW